MKLSLLVFGVIALAGTSALASAQATSSTTTSPSGPAVRADACGMTEETATFRDLQVGSVVTLQRHRWVRGEANWREEMVRYVGRAARVTRLSGVDAQGCAGVRVDVDHEQYFWRVRDLGIGLGRQGHSTVQGDAGSTGFPQECRMADGQERYGAAAIGMAVILGRHRSVDGDANWSEEMARFVGRTAHVTRLAGIDGPGCPVVQVDIDEGQFFWRLRDLRPVAGADLASLTLVPSAGVTTDHGRPAVSTIGGGSGLFGAGGSPGPQACGMSDGTVQWESLAVGVEVILGRHRAVNGDDNWDPQMEPFVGRTGRVTELVGVDDQGCALVHVDTDRGQWFWRTRDLVITQLSGTDIPGDAGTPSP